MLFHSSQRLFPAISGRQQELLRPVSRSSDDRSTSLNRTRLTYHLRVYLRLLSDMHKYHARLRQSLSFQTRRPSHKWLQPRLSRCSVTLSQAVYRTLAATVPQHTAHFCKSVQDAKSFDRTVKLTMDCTEYSNSFRPGWRFHHEAWRRVSFVS